RREIAVDGYIFRSVSPIERDVRTNHGVDGILVPVELSRPCCGLHPPPQLSPGHTAIRPQPRAGTVESLDECHQPEQLAMAILEGASLVLQDLLEFEQHDRRR